MQGMYPGCCFCCLETGIFYRISLDDERCQKMEEEEKGKFLKEERKVSGWKGTPKGHTLIHAPSERGHFVPQGIPYNTKMPLSHLAILISCHFKRLL